MSPASATLGDQDECEDRFGDRVNTDEVNVGSFASNEKELKKGSAACRLIGCVPKKKKKKAKASNVLTNKRIESTRVRKRKPIPL